jgi:RNA ligase (TIGR02306 family)
MERTHTDDCVDHGLDFCSCPDEQPSTNAHPERKLASIQTILKLDPIPGADAIEKATVLGWELVVKKGEFHVGDPCVYIEVDAILPDRPEFEFLRARHFRIKTIRLRKQISQGIAFPLSILPETQREQMLKAPVDRLIGVDVTEMLGIIKYEPYIPAQLAGICKSTFPSWLVKTDETRIQAEPKVLDRHKGKSFYITEKVDGSSMTVYYRDGEFGVCSRNLDLKEDENNSFWKKANELGLKEKMAALGKNYALQGELLGQGIQKNKYNFPDTRFYLFNIFDVDAHRFLDFPEFRTLANILCLSTVPIVEETHVLLEDVPTLVKLSNAPSLLNKATPREGIVLRPWTEERDEDLGRLSFKVINPEFLLKYDE